MIGRLSGRVLEESSDGVLVVDVAGVGYEVAAPLGTVGRAAALDASSAVTLFVHTHVREDALLLYGFLTREDRAAFRALISISNIGPKSAMAIMSVLSASELASAIARGETGRLTGVPGVGKKTAQRIVLELKDKLAPPIAATLPAAQVHAAPKNAKGDLLFGALTGMGFRPIEAERAIAALGERVGSTGLDDLVRDALAVLAR